MKLTIDQAVKKLVPLVEARKLVIFAGSGISVESGLPSWDGLLRSFIDFCRDVQEQLPANERFPNILSEAEDYKSQYPLRVASVLKNRLFEIQNDSISNVEDMFKSWALELFLTDVAPNDKHKFIVGTDYPYILTSNYDNLLERAAKELGYKQLLGHSFSFMEANKLAKSIYADSPAIVHLHGDVKSMAIGDFVFTSEDYVKIRNNYPGFTLAIQSIFMRYSTLFVGYGGSDPHFEEFYDEFSYYLNYSIPDSFLLLKKDKVNEILELYKDNLSTTLITVDDFSESTYLLKQLQEAAPREILT